MSQQIPEINADENAIAKLAIANVEFGRQQEQERIINLLKIKLRTVQVKGYPEWTWQTNAEIIALIKGEK